MLYVHESPSASSLMTTRSDDNLENAGAPQKLEWVAPKISLMEAGDTEGKLLSYTTESTNPRVSTQVSGPS